MNTIIEKIRAEKIIRLIISILEDKHPNTFWRSNEMESGVYTEELVSFLSDLEKKYEDFPTTDEEMKQLLATHPKVKAPDRYKTPDWMFDGLTPEEKMNHPIYLEGFEVGRKVGLVLAEKPTTAEGLEGDLDEAAKQFVGYDMDTDDLRDYEIGVSSFKAGAKWQEEQDLKYVSEIHQNGYNLCKERMMKGAVEGEVCGRVYDHINVRFADGVCKFLEPKNISHIPADVSKYNIGQKVKIIIVKED